MTSAATIYSQRPRALITRQQLVRSPHTLKSTVSNRLGFIKWPSLQHLRKNVGLCRSKAEEEVQPVEIKNDLVKDSGQDGARVAEATKGSTEWGLYPTEDSNGEGGFFPVREPGDFPPVEIKKKKSELKEPEEFDPLRDGPLRYLGYANELGEAFNAWLPPGSVPLSYAIAIAYVLVDTADKGIKAYSKSGTELASLPDINPAVDTKRLAILLSAERVIDTLIWQLMASVAFPGYTIHTIVAVVHNLLKDGLQLENPNGPLPAAASFFAATSALLHVDVQTIINLTDKSIPTFAGLATIPFIVHPIDNLVHAILNISMRPKLRQFLCDNGQGRLAGLAICDEQCMIDDFPILSEENNLIQAFTKSFEED